MGLVSGIIVFCCVWWIIFFMTLPFGVQQETVFEKGHDIGAPKNPRLLLKILITTAIATGFWFVIDFIICHHLIQFSDLK